MLACFDMQTNAVVPHALIAVPTYRRATTLPGLIERIRAEAAATDARVECVVIDNDPEGSAAAAAGEAGVGYVAEPTPGIAAARQRALDVAGPDQLVVMLDDDLVPEPGWLQGLIDAWAPTSPAVVMGYVRYVWPEGTDPFVSGGGFMRRTRFPTGTELSALSTGNALFDTPQLRRLGARFDVGMGLSGGSDLAFGRYVLAAGGRIVASAESVARDDIVPERTTRSFVRNRAICQGEVRVRVLSHDDRPASRVVKRAGHLVGGLLRIPAFAAGEGVARLRHDATAAAVYRRRRWFAQGRVLGAVGASRAEYTRDTALTLKTSTGGRST